MENIRFFLSENFRFLGVKFSVYFRNGCLVGSHVNSSVHDRRNCLQERLLSFNFFLKVSLLYRLRLFVLW